MWPQLLINHRLRTVDMLPLTAFLYRFLTTFIDDLYALVVPMPLLERIGTLRDDLVFVVLCYQWYKFPRRKDADVAARAGSSDPAAGSSAENTFIREAGTEAKLGSRSLPPHKRKTRTNKGNGESETKSEN
ncbi:hypothetical protein GGI22_007121 [Coemansia erecta]|nr:hypothetical protein GGI22_007121 [Coemansia erecta]